MKPALLLVDLQNDFLRSPRLEPAAGAIVARAAMLLAGCRRLSLPVIHAWTTVRREPDRRMPHWKRTGKWMCVEGTEGHATPEVLRPVASETIVHKTFFSAFEDGGLDRILRSLACDTLWIAGVHLHGCVRATASDAYQHGFEVCVAEDAVGSDDPLHAAITRRYLEERAIRFLPVASLLSAERDVARGGEDQVAEATTAAADAWQGWQRTPLASRVAALDRLAALLTGESAALAKEMAGEIGKPLRYANAELARAVALLNAASRRAAEPLEGRCGKDSGFRYRPHGVVAVVTPWNNPVAIPIGKIAPALFYGNTVVWKPAPEADSISTWLAALMQSAGFPPGAVNCVRGGRSTAMRLMNDDRVGAVTFTGSTAAGCSAQEICARRHVPLQAELGGNNAAVVWPDCDLASAAAQIAEAAFGFAGQRCTANRRAIVDRSCYDDFLRKLRQAVNELFWGDPLDERTHVGPLVSAARRDQVAAVVSRAEAASEAVFTARQPAPGGPRAYYPPTVICCNDPAREIVQEETFGPVLVVQRADGWDHAIRLCNGVRQGLAASFFSNSRERQAAFHDAAVAGIVKLNAATADADAEAPFGGWKASGCGPPEHGAANREFYTRTQTVYTPGR